MEMNIMLPAELPVRLATEDKAIQFHKFTRPSPVFFISATITLVIIICALSIAAEANESTTSISLCQQPVVAPFVHSKSDEVYLGLKFGSVIVHNALVIRNFIFSQYTFDDLITATDELPIALRNKATMSDVHMLLGDPIHMLEMDQGLLLEVYGFDKGLRFIFFYENNMVVGSMPFD